MVWWEVAVSESKIYVGSLPFDANEDALREALGEFGEIRSISMSANRETGRHDSPGPFPIFLGIERDRQSRAVPWCPALDL